MFLKVISNLFSKIKMNWKYVLMTVVIVAVLIIGGIFIKKVNVLDMLRSKLKVMQYKRDIAYLQGKREILLETEGASEEKIKELEEKIDDLDHALLAERELISEMKLEELEDEFNKRGY